MRALAEHLWDSPDLSSKRFAVQGVGKVGSDLVRRLVREGAEVVATDIYGPARERVEREYGLETVDPDAIYGVDCDVFVPCSLGATLNSDTIPRLNCRAVLGSANNQLEQEKDALVLQEREIVYCPDFVVNSGGLINVWEEMRGYEEERAAHNIDKIYGLTKRVLRESVERDETPHQTSVQLARERIEAIGQLRLFRRGGDDRN
jgi:leucine dehydrogenase